MFLIGYIIVCAVLIAAYPGFVVAYNGLLIIALIAGDIGVYFRQNPLEAGPWWLGYFVLVVIEVVAYEFYLRSDEGKRGKHL